MHFGSVAGFFCGRIWGRLGLSRALVGTILEMPRCVWGSLRDVLPRPRGGPKSFLQHLGASWKLSGMFRGRLGHPGGVSGLIPCKSLICDGFFIQILISET